jgi:hypothetical protein
MSPLETSDVVGATTVYYVPAGDVHVSIYDGTKLRSHAIATQLSLALDNATGHAGYHEAGKNFDIFVVDDNGTLRLGTGPSWASSTTRGVGAGTTDIESLLGLYVNANSVTIRFGASSGDTVIVPARRATYVGSFRAVANGQASDTKAKRLLFNAYNQALRPLLVSEPARDWFYSTAVWRQANGNAANQIELLFGLAGGGVFITQQGLVSNDTTTPRGVRSGIGLDSTTGIAVASLAGLVSAVSTGALGIYSNYSGDPGLGYHYLAWLEFGNGVDTQRWFGTDTVSGNFRSGMVGTVVL